MSRYHLLNKSFSISPCPVIFILQHMVTGKKTCLGQHFCKIITLLVLKHGQSVFYHDFCSSGFV